MMPDALLEAVGACRLACIAASTVAPIGGPIYRAARLMEEIDLVAEVADRRSAVLLAQAALDAGLIEACRTAARQLRRGMGAQECRTRVTARQTTADEPSSSTAPHWPLIHTLAAPPG
jgi:hypothetical protein